MKKYFIFAASPLRRFAASPLRRFAASPLRRFAASPLRRFALVFLLVKLCFECTMQQRQRAL
jgi:hypothetical protein